MRYLGIDWGMRSLGFAISEGTLAAPLKSVEVKSLNQALHLIGQVIREENIQMVVVGRPESGEIRKVIEEVVEILRGQGIKVETVEENLSTYEATLLMIKMGTSKSKRSQDHSYAASVILQEYLNNLN